MHRFSKITRIRRSSYLRVVAVAFACLMVVPAAAQASTTLSAGQTLQPGQALWSANGYAAIMQGDGNFVVYAPGSRAIWNSGTQGNPGAFVAMQGDGNLVVYTANGRALWASSTNPSASDQLVMQTDGNLVIYSFGQALWSSYGGRIRYPVLNNNSAAWTPASCYTGCSGGNIYPADGTPFGMDCYFDANYQMGNYWTNRYFVGVVFGHSGLWVVHASYVLNQVNIGHC